MKVETAPTSTVRVVDFDFSLHRIKCYRVRFSRSSLWFTRCGVVSNYILSPIASSVCRKRIACIASFNISYFFFPCRATFLCVIVLAAPLIERWAQSNAQQPLCLLGCSSQMLPWYLRWFFLLKVYVFPCRDTVTPTAACNLVCPTNLICPTFFLTFLLVIRRWSTIAGFPGYFIPNRGHQGPPTNLGMPNTAAASGFMCFLLNTSCGSAVVRSDVSRYLERSVMSCFAQPKNR